MTSSPLIAIVGPTATGKSALAIKLSLHLGGEIICADSRTVYKGLDIGTAKPSKHDQAKVPHHLIDIVNPDQRFTVADFKSLAIKAISDISSRGKLPIIVGGSGLYIDSVLFDYVFEQKDSTRNPLNPRHLDSNHQRQELCLRSNTLVLGLDLPQPQLKQRIESRIEGMVEAGFIEEVRTTRRTFAGTKALDAPGYKAFVEYLDGTISLEKAKKNFMRNDTQLARRQRTWFKRNKSIHWTSNPSEAVDIATTFLNKKQ